MAYKKTLWKDRVVEKPNTYRTVENPDGTITLYPITGQVIEKGTPISATNLNKIENGIVEVYEQLDIIETENNNKFKFIQNPSYTNDTIICFVDDDGSSAFLNKIKPTFDAKGLKCSLGVITNNIATESGGFHMTLDELKSLQNDGFEILSHSHTHAGELFSKVQMDNATDEDIVNDLITSQNYMRENGLNGYNTLVIPYGNYDTNERKLRIKSLARKVFLNAIDSIGKSNSLPFDNMLMERSFIQCRNSSEATNLEYFINKHVKVGGITLLGFHAWEGNVEAEGLSQLIDYILSKGYKIMTVGEALKSKNNIVSIGDFTDEENCFYIGANGNVKSIAFDSMISKINAIPQGGENLLNGTKLFDDTYWKAISIAVATITPAYYGVYSSLTINANWMTKGYSFNFIKGQVYTLSFLAKADNLNTNIKVAVSGGKTEGNFDINTTLVDVTDSCAIDNLAKYEATFTWNYPTQKSNIYVTTNTINAVGGNLNICCMMLEKGEIASESYRQSMSDIEKIISII